MIPWPAASVEHMSSPGPVPSWNARTVSSRAAGESRPSRCPRVREAGEQRLLHLGVVGEHHERLPGRAEVLDPGGGGASLPARRAA